MKVNNVIYYILIDLQYKETGTYFTYFGDQRTKAIIEESKLVLLNPIIVKQKDRNFKVSKITLNSNDISEILGKPRNSFSDIFGGHFFN